MRALLMSLDEWVRDGRQPPASMYPKIADGTLTAPDRAGWPAIPGYQLPQQPLRAFHLNFGPEWSKDRIGVVFFDSLGNGDVPAAATADFSAAGAS